MEDKILKFVSVDDVPEGCRDLVDIFGMDVFIRLIFLVWMFLLG